MEVTLFKFNKPHVNSTQRPVKSIPMVNPYYEIDCIINDDNTSVCNVTLTVTSGRLFEINAYNYCYIPAFERYYWIEDWRYSKRGLWIAYCRVDVLASFKDNILASTGYVTRTSHPQYYDRTIIDTAFPAKNDYYLTETSFNNSLWFSSVPTDCIFIIGCISTQAPTFGALNYFYLNSQNFATLVANLVTLNGSNYTVPADWGNASIGGELLKSIVSPMQYLKSCLWFPLKYETVFAYSQQTETEIYLGPWNTGAVGLKITSANCNKTIPCGVYMPAYPSDTTKEYSAYPPYANYTFNSSLFGEIPLDPTILGNIAYKRTTGMYVNCDVNFITGKALLKFSANNFDEPAQGSVLPPTYVFKMGEYNIAADIPVSDVSYNYAELAKTSANIAGNATNMAGWFTNPGGNLAAITNGVIDAACYALAPSESGIGNAKGGFYSDVGLFKVIARYIPRCNADIIHIGLPCNKLLAFNALNGWFVRAVDIDLNIASGSTDHYILKSEYDALIEFIKDGVFLI